MDSKWERSMGGTRPSWHLRRYTVSQWNPLLGTLYLVSPKKQRWAVYVQNKLLCYLDGIPQEEALGAAKMLIEGAAG